MAIPITIPRLGWSMEEGVFAGWLKHNGETIRAGDALFALESEKATEEVECLDSGVLRIPADSPKPGEAVRVGDVIGYLVQRGETLTSELSCKRERENTLPVCRPASPKRTEVNVDEHSDVAISPRARRVAREIGIDWMNLKGTGRNGRIRERDVRAAMQNILSKPVIPNQESVRRIIAERMRHSLSTTAPVTLTTTADVARLTSIRQQFEQHGEPNAPTYTDFFVKLAAFALVDHPRLNSRWENERVVLIKEINIGIAVDTEVGLMAPVIRDVPRLTLKELAAQSRDLINRAKEGTLRTKEIEGGTFTVTNLGAFGIDSFTPIINWPECAILGIGRIRRQPVVVDDNIVPRDQVTLSLTFDHRIADGADAARFLQSLVARIENPPFDS
jgi:pyruvate dehydrogenase E2 component (dihydrolipoamide acetyltransferase)